MRYLLFLLSFLATVVGMGQARNANWVFADGMWMAFTDSSMTMLPSPYSGPARSACISDTVGQFLLLVDDTGIRNNLFNLVGGGSAAEMGWTSLGANYLILPKPGSPDTYCIFINEESPLARAGVLEISVDQNSGAGQVLGPTSWYMEHATAKLTATTDEAGTGYWVVQHADSGDAFLAFHLTAQGLDPVPVISHVGAAYTLGAFTFGNWDGWGPMKFSFQGDKLAAIVNGVEVDSNALELFHFDRGNGSLDLWAHLLPRTYRRVNGEWVVHGQLNYHLFTGFEFDPKGMHLYAAHSDTLTHYTITSQIDLLNPDPEVIQGTMFMVQGIGAYYQEGYAVPGSQMLFGNNGLLYQRDLNGVDASLDFLQEWLNLPTESPLPLLDYGWFAPHPYAPHILGFPNLCKRYLDSAPLTTAVAAVAHAALFTVHPNPMTELAILDHSGAQPTTIRWRDALGRVVREGPLARNGTSIALHRNGLPAGFYTVELIGKDRSLGFARVMCQ
ncbi:MAG: hypothetical protein ABIQ75_03185 [Flavobacteriales bacterium]